MYLYYAKRLWSMHKSGLTHKLCVGVLLCASLTAYASVVRTVRTQLVDAETLAPYSMPERPMLYMDASGAELGEQGDANGHLLEISFDEMSHDYCQFTYTIRHTNADGQADALTSSEYLNGFTTRDITDYTPSLNTQQVYTHYRLIFPNEDMRLTRSGRYELTVYEDGNPDKVVTRVPIWVCDTRVRVDAQVLSTTDKEFSGRYQQLEVELQTDGRSSDVRNDYFIVVQQNGRTDNMVVAPQPTFADYKTLRWQHCRQLIFEGGDEYRHFDAYSTYFAGTGIDRIVYENGDYHALLNADALRHDQPYAHEYDVNGQYRVHAERVQDVDTEAEYMWVHWMLRADKPMFDGAIYVGGDLFGNTFSLRNRMDYDNTMRCYYLSAPVKQGGYDYQYWFVPKQVESQKSKVESPATLLRTEGSHWETRNEYTIYVYYKPFGARYEQLVGVKVL